MAFTSEGSVGTANSKTAGATLAVTVGGAIAAGQLLAVFVAWDNNNTGTPDDGPMSNQHSVIDSIGNIYTTVVSGQERAAGQATGAHGSIHLCRVQTAFSGGETITARLCTGNNLTAKAMSVWEFSSDTSMVWSSYDRHFELTPGADPQSISLSSLPSQEYLMLHVLAAEGPNTDAYTWDSDYTEITGDGTTGGTDASNMHVRGGFRIATLTSDTVNVSSDTADRDYWQGLVAIYEAEYDDVFPAESLLDDFNRANETPLSGGGDWDTTTYPFTGDPYLELDTNVVKAKTGTSQFTGQWWDEDEENNCEVWVTMAAVPTGAQDGIYIALHCAETLTAFRGYMAAWRRPEFSVGPDQIVSGLCITTSGGDVIDADDNARLLSWQDDAAGVKLGLQRRGNENHTWVDTGSGWRWIGAYYHSTYDSGRLFLGVRDSATRADDFGGGPFGIPQFYRRL